MLFKVEKDVPLPLDEEPRTISWPFKVMNVGESVTIPAELVVKALNAVRGVEARSTRNFVKRRLVDGSLRIWRKA